MKLKTGNEFMHHIKHPAGSYVELNTVRKSMFF